MSFADAHVHVIAPALLGEPGGPREVEAGLFAFEE
jgi:hypothetical protein